MNNFNINYQPSINSCLAISLYNLTFIGQGLGVIKKIIFSCYAKTNFFISSCMRMRAS